MLLRYRGDISVPAMPHARRQLQSDIPLRGHEAKALGGPGILRREALNFSNSFRAFGNRLKLPNCHWHQRTVDALDQC